MLSFLTNRRRYTYPLLLMLFNSVDTFCTLVAIDNGATEFNIIMAAVLAYGVLYFLFVKLIAVNMLILFVGLVGQRYWVGRMGLSVVVWIYALLTCYHFINLSRPFLTAIVH